MFVAKFLESHPAVESVTYPGLESHPDHSLALKQMKGFGGIVSFTVRGDRTAACRVAESTSIFTLAVSLGGMESLIEHPASLSHAPLSDEEMKLAGIEPGLIRLSVGAEDVDDLLGDLDQALEVVSA